jgi:hypothetical protein
VIFCPKMGGEAGKKIEELGILNLDRRGTREEVEEVGGMVGIVLEGEQAGPASSIVDVGGT